MIPTDPRPTAYPEWDDLVADEQLLELRKGAESRYFDDFAEDPQVSVECFWCGARFTITAESTTCDECRWDYDTPRRFEADDVQYFDREAA